jgi:hypothetical protein
MGLAAHAVGGALKRLPRKQDWTTTLLVLAAIAPPAVSTLLGAPRGEVEHAYLLFVPLVVMACAATAHRWYAREDRWLLTVVLPLLIVQSTLIEIFAETYW